MALADRVRVDGLLFDRLVLAKAALLLVAAAVGWRLTRRSTWLSGVELVSLAAAAAAGASLLFVPLAPEAGRPVVTGLVAVVPQRPGPNLVHVATDEPLTVNGVRSRALAGSTGQWVSLDLPAGRSTLDLGDLGTSVVDTGHGRPLAVSGPECASALLQGATACPDTALAAADAVALRALARLSHGGEPPSPEALTALVAERAGRDGAMVLNLLYGPPPADDAALVRLASELDRLTHDALTR